MKRKNKKNHLCHDDLNCNTVLARLFGCTDIEAQAVSVFLSRGWSLELGPDFTLIGLKKE